MSRWRAFLGALLAVCIGSVAAPARAHPARTSAAFFDVGETAVGMELQVPAPELALALEAPSLVEDPRRYLSDHEAALRAYALAHVGASAKDGRAFRVDLRELRIERIDGGDALVLRAVLEPPAGADPTSFVFHDDAVLHRVVTHNTFVSVRRDFRNGVLPDRPEIVGILAYQRESVAVDQSHGSWWAGLSALFSLGARHIAEGTDHLLFLLVLLLPAPLLVEARRWSRAGSVGRSARQVAAIVTAFTFGHSLTLALASFGVLRLPSRPVEMAIAVSILVSAVHALRPWMKGREPIVAGLFGLVHGLAFASVLEELGFHGKVLAMSLVAFNLGIEAMQLAVVLLVMPSLLVLARSKRYSLVRIGGAVLAAIAALGWIVERGSGTGNRVSLAVAAAAAHGEVFVLALAALAATVLGQRWARGATARRADAP